MCEPQRRVNVYTAGSNGSRWPAVRSTECKAVSRREKAPVGRGLLRGVESGERRLVNERLVSTTRDSSAQGVPNAWLPRTAVRRSTAKVILGFILVLMLGLTGEPVFAKDKPRQAPPAKAAKDYVASDVHDKEHVAVGVEPCDDPKVCSFFRLPYIQHGFIPVRVVITNEGDRALSLDDVRIQFISENRDVIPAATPEDINRRLFTKRSAEGTRIPGLPIPLTVHHAPIDKQVTADDDDFGFPGTVVNAHSSLSGYLFYDVRGLDDPVMRGAEIYVKMVKSLDGKQELFPFSVPLNKWLDAQPKPVKQEGAAK